MISVRLSDFLAQTINYIAEHVVGTGSFGVVFQVTVTLLCVSV